MLLPGIKGQHQGLARWRQPCSGGTPSLSDQATLPWRGVRNRTVTSSSARPRCASSRSRTSRSPASTRRPPPKTLIVASVVVGVGAARLGLAALGTPHAARTDAQGEGESQCFPRTHSGTKARIVPPITAPPIQLDRSGTKPIPPSNVATAGQHVERPCDVAVNAPAACSVHDAADPTDEERRGPQQHSRHGRHQAPKNHDCRRDSPQEAAVSGE